MREIKTEANITEKNGELKARVELMGLKEPCLVDLTEFFEDFKEQTIELTIRTKQKSTRPRKIETLAAHAGENWEMSSIPIFPGVTSYGRYSRTDGDQTQQALEKLLERLEGAKYIHLTSTGMAALTSTVLSLLSPGDTILCHRSVYSGMYSFLKDHLPRISNITTQFIDMTDLSAVEAALQQTSIPLMHFETISNPIIDVLDVEKLCEIGHKAGAMVVVDNTFASPYLVKPLELGADIAIESATKFLSGHGDTMGGIIGTDNQNLFDKITSLTQLLGCSLSPFNAYLILRGIKTLPIRMDKLCENANELTKYLKTQSPVKWVRYPGDPDHPDYAVAKNQMACYGSMLAFTLGVHNGQFINSLSLAKNWVSLGDTHTLVTYRAKSPAQGIEETFLRVSVGLEDIQDIIHDFDQALASLEN